MTKDCRKQRRKECLQYVFATSGVTVALLEVKLFIQRLVGTIVFTVMIFLFSILLKKRPRRAISFVLLKPRERESFCQYQRIYFTFVLACCE
jgi:ABC-type uncharacterized transport system permease subunit